MVRAQGGDPHAPLPRAGEIEIVPAPSTGTRSKRDAMSVGVAAWRLGAGRARKEDPVSAVAGVVWRSTVGDEVRAGEPLRELQPNDPARLPGALHALDGPSEVSPASLVRPPMLLASVG